MADLRKPFVDGMRGLGPTPRKPAGFPEMNNPGKPVVEDGEVTFSYATSLSEPMTVTKPVLTPKQVLALVSARFERFYSQPPGTRESELSRGQRKYVAAQPKAILYEAWEKADSHQRMEMEMMLSKASHVGPNDPKWLKEHVRKLDDVIGDDGKTLGG